MIRYRENVPLTEAMLSALKWLRNRGGDGVFGEKSNKTVLLAGGDRAPIMRVTWTRLCAAGLCESHGHLRLRETAAGRKIDLAEVSESVDTK